MNLSLTPIHNFDGAPCIGRWDLFTDATHPAEHKAAAALCRTCPANHFAACRDELNEQRQSPRHTPTGTWAAELYNEKGLVDEPRGPGRPRKDKAA